MRQIGWMVLLVACGNIGEIRAPPTVNIITNAPVAPISLTVDTFRQVPEPKVDVLFVVDNSSSMGDEQAALAENFPLFLSYFQGSGLDYHIGVVATDVQRPEYSGRLRISEGYNFIDEDTVMPERVFSGMTQNLGVITNSAESGRKAAYYALEVNAGHPDNMNFYRDEAELHIVFVSDTYDNSDQPSEIEFLAWTRTMKNSGRKVSLHAIVQLPNDSSCNTNIRPGFDYLRYAAETNGVFGSICDENWNPVLDSLGLLTSGPKQEFFLRNLPELSQPIVVRVNTTSSNGNDVSLAFQVCLAGEEATDPECEVIYNLGRNSVVFLDYVANPLAEVEITYTRREDVSAGDDGAGINGDTGLADP